MADVKWIKIVTNVFDDEKLLLIETLPEADSIIVIWFKLLCLAGKQNNSGVFLMNDRIPYTEKMLATIFRRKESTVQLALRTFQDFGMIEIVDGVITIPNWGKHQNFDKIEKNNEYMRNYMRDYRAKQKLLAGNTEEKPSNVTSVTSEVNCKVNSKVNSKSNVSGLDKNRIDKNRIDNIKDIVEYLNLKTNSKYKPSTKSTKDSIIARLNEGFTVEDFKIVIDNQYAKWHNTEWEQYLRPQTLFGTKFESIDWNEWDKKNNNSSELDSTEIDKLLQEGEIF